VTGMTRTWTVGELARSSGVTVRALHHYDALGLLAPTARSEGGYRLYDEAAVERLYRIRALQSLGLTLGEVAAALDGAPLGDVIARQLEALDRELEHARTLRLRLLALQETASVDDLMTTMEAIEMHERYFTGKQREAIASRAHLAEQGERDWAALIEEVGAARDAGEDPRGPRMQELAARWRALVEQFTGGDAGVRDALVQMYREEGAEAASRGAVDPELMRYIGEALRDQDVP
jgi:MerR family transcriptional regulator, thiopeptide resistance regulator